MLVTLVPVVMVVVVVVVVIMTVPVMMIVAMVTAAQNKHARAVDEKTKYRNSNRLVKHDVDRINQSTDTGDSHVTGEQGQKHRAGETAKCVDLARTEAEIAVSRVTPRIDIGKRRDAKRHGVRAHVQAVGK